MITTKEAKNASWVCCILTLVLLTLHLGLSLFSQKGRIDLVSGLVIVSMFLVIARLVVNTILLAHVTAHDALAMKLTGVDLDDVKSASILSLVTRVIATAIYWLQVAILLAFYSRIMGHILWATIMIKVCLVSLCLTFIAVVLVTFLECRPFRLYWQLSPPPGNCTDAYSQLLLQCFCNIFLDLMVLVISLPLLKFRHRDASKNLRLGVLFGLGTLTVIVTCVRMSQVIKGGSSQAARRLWASIQLLTSTLVANIPFIYGTGRLVLLSWQSSTNQPTV